MSSRIPKLDCTHVSCNWSPGVSCTYLLEVKLNHEPDCLYVVGRPVWWTVIISSMLLLEHSLKTDCSPYYMTALCVCCTWLESSCSRSMYEVNDGTTLDLNLNLVYFIHISGSQFIHALLAIWSIREDCYIHSNFRWVYMSFYHDSYVD